MKTLILSILLPLLQGGCAMLNDGHPMTESAFRGEKERAFWLDHQASRDKSTEWRAEDRRKARARMEANFE